jgi:biopolymer transport protein ExbD
MAKFQRKGKKGSPGISTASLPDIVFMLLFFFMTVTVMKETELKIAKPVLPKASEVKKMENKSLISHIYIAKPLLKDQGVLGTAPRIQINDDIAKDVSEIERFIESERAKTKEIDKPKMMTALKVDENVRMGIITEVKLALRKVQMLKLIYSTRKEEVAG